jgi:hypothetical protein
MTDHEFAWRLEQDRLNAERSIAVDNAISIVHMFRAIRGERCQECNDRYARTIESCVRFEAE